MKKTQLRLLIISIICVLSYVILFFQSSGLEGGQDSWNHYIISKYALKYPNLLIDQWNKPIFTWATVLVSQLGYKYLIVYNMLLIVLSSILVYKSLKFLGINYAEFSIPILLFMPIVLGNSISCLTEPLNMFWLSIVVYFWVISKHKTALLLASFLPFLRTEGFVILGAMFIHLMIKKEYKILPYILVGSIVLNIVGFIITGKPFWIISENPYLRFQLDSSFDPGNGSFFHYFKRMDVIFGLIGVIGMFLSFFFYKKFSEKLKDIFWLNLLIIFFYILAHTIIFYLGILGSHGIIRVMMVVAPSVVILTFIGFSFLFSSNQKIQKFNLISWLLIALISFIVGYKKSNYSFPFQVNGIAVKQDVHNLQFEKAGKWLQDNNLIKKRIIHQSPYFNVRFDKDPYDPTQTYYNWSINKENDWTEIGSIVVWDNFYSLREGGLPLEWLSENPHYKLIKRFDTEDDVNLKIIIFEKVN